MTEINRCNFFINLAKEGEAVIRSPGFPFRYGQGLNCTWTIDAGTSNFVKLEIVYVNLAKSTTEIELKEVITYWTKLMLIYYKFAILKVFICKYLLCHIISKY